ncbi:hypothetical protein [Sphingopyxis sp. NJF-3]
MSKPLKILGTVAGVVALVAGTIATAGIGTAAFAAVAGTVASAASIASGIAMLGSQALAKPPPARGSITQIIVDPNSPQPYVMGGSHFAGVLRHRAGYGGTVDKVPNPYLFDAVVYSGGGPVQSISPRIDYAAVPSWYSGYLYTDTQLGACPESNALTPQFAGTPGWGSAYKLSGQAAIGWSYKFDKKGKKFANGLPVTGAYVEGVKVYDPRLDSTFPGGSGSCRLGDESTYVYSTNPALHAGTYAYGRYQNGKRTFGIGLPADGIDWAVVAAWANVCDANGWTISGVCFEPGDRSQNLIDICAAGSGEPVPGGILSFKYDAPAVALDTITEEDIADGNMSVVAMQSYRDRLNTILPKYRSADHNWEMTQADAVTVPEYVTEDGEERSAEWPFNFVKDVDQAAQLAAYRLVNGRELHPIELPCLPRLRAYRPGDCLHLDLPQLGLDTDAIILNREIDPGTMTVKLTLIGETPAKHAYALGETGVAPPTPALGQTPQERDETAGGVKAGAALRFASKTVNYPLSSDEDSISIAAFSGVLSNAVPLTLPADTIPYLDSSTTYGVFWDIVNEEYLVSEWPSEDEMANSNYAFLGYQNTAGEGGVYPDPDPPPPGNCVADDTPILLAGGATAPASDLVPGTVVRTRHETTMAWGEWPVLAISFADEPVFACELEGDEGPVTIRATADHRFLVNNRWVRASELGEADGTARVAKITVADAHTYISNGVISHNAKAEGPGDGPI